MSYDPKKNGWNRDWETDNVPDEMADEIDMSHVHLEVCPVCDMPSGECEHGSLAEHYPPPGGLL